jgi:ribonuclease Z
VNGVRPDQVMGEPRRGRKVVLTGDTAPSEMTGLVAWEADLLVHEATFADEEAERAVETAHSTARQAGELAAAANVNMLALTHISPRYAGGELRDEARAAFSGPAERVIVPRDFDRVEIPFPERGEPVHVRGSESPPQPLAPEPAPGGGRPRTERCHERARTRLQIANLGLVRGRFGQARPRSSS